MDSQRLSLSGGAGRVFILSYTFNLLKTFTTKVQESGESILYCIVLYCIVLYCIVLY